MKKEEEPNTPKEEVETASRKSRALNETEQAQVAGGDIEITFDLIMEYIKAGNERCAAGYFNLAQYYLAPIEQYRIRMAFWDKFGYPIEMYVE